MTDWIEHWRGWSRCTGKLLWRAAEAKDLPAIRRLQNVAERFSGVPQRRPNLFDLPVLLTLVAEDQNGKIIDALYLEAQVEIVKLASTAAGFEESEKLQNDLVPWLRSLGFRTCLATTPHQLKEKMTPGLLLSGFRCLDKALSHWARWI